MLASVNLQWFNGLVSLGLLVAEQILEIPAFLLIFLRVQYLPSNCSCSNPFLPPALTPSAAGLHTSRRASPPAGPAVRCAALP